MESEVVMDPTGVSSSQILPSNSGGKSRSVGGMVMVDLDNVGCFSFSILDLDYAEEALAEILTDVRWGVGEMNWTNDVYSDIADCRLSA